MSDYNFVPYEFPKSTDGRFVFMQEDHQILLSRREQLGLTQQQVADIARVQLRQYQRIESGERHIMGCTMKIGLAVCAALLLDPYEFFGPTIQQPDAGSIRPLPTHDVDLPDDFFPPKRPGRKPLRREMKVYLNHEHYALIIPEGVLTALGRPDYIQYLYNDKEARIAIRSAKEADEQSLDVPELAYQGNPFVIYNPEFAMTLRKRMGWENELYAADARPAKDNSGQTVIVIELAGAVIAEPVCGPFTISRCVDNGEDGF